MSDFFDPFDGPASQSLNDYNNGFAPWVTDGPGTLDGAGHLSFPPSVYGRAYIQRADTNTTLVITQKPSSGSLGFGTSGSSWMWGQAYTGAQVHLLCSTNEITLISTYGSSPPFILSGPLPWTLRLEAAVATKTIKLYFNETLVITYLGTWAESTGVGAFDRTNLATDGGGAGTLLIGELYGGTKPVPPEPPPAVFWTNLVGTRETA